MDSLVYKERAGKNKGGARQDGKEATARQKRLAIFKNKKLLFASHYTVLEG